MGRLLDQTLNLSCISYKPKINSRRVQGDMNKAGARIAMGGRDGEGNEDGEVTAVQTTVPDESWVDLSVHGFLKWGTYALFDM